MASGPVAARALHELPLARRLAPRVARWIFPAVLFGAVGAALAMLRAGVDPLVALPAAQLPAFLIVIAAERLFPHQLDWKRSHGDLRTDVAHFFSIATTVALLDPALRLAGLFVAVQLSGLLDVGVWPTGWPLLAQLALALVLVEFFQYWVHRLQHEVDGLWRFHAVHHSAPRLYWLNASRFHPVDIFLNRFFGLIPLFALGAGAPVLALWTLVEGIHGIFQHAIVRLRLGPLNWVFSMAELHRWHHSRLLEEANRNYGQNLILWDIVFGTRYLPADRQPPADIGIADLPGFPRTFFAQLASPFRWRAIRDV